MDPTEPIPPVRGDERALEDPASADGATTDPTAADPATSDPTAADPTDAEAGSPRSSALSQPAARWSLVALAVLVLVVGGAALTLAALQASTGDRVLAGVRVDGVDVGGLDRGALVGAVAGRADERLAVPVVITIDGDTTEGTLRDAGVEADVELAVEQAWAYGREGWWRALREQLGARTGSEHDVPLGLDVDEGRLQAFADEVAEELTVVPRAAELSLTTVDGEVAIDAQEPQAGQEVDTSPLRDAVLAGYPDDTPIEVELEARPVDPPVTEADLDAGLAAAERATAAEVVLANPTDGDDLVLAPADLADLLDVATDLQAPEGERLTLEVDADAVRDRFDDDTRAALETDPVEASFAFVDGSVEIDGGTSGFEVDPEPVPDLVLELAAGDPDDDGARSTELPGEVVEPDLTREAAEELGIVEEVSSFTTPLTPGEPRNDNIRRAADLIHEDVILPGERYSLNEGIGERTADRGFVENGFIEDGELISVTGGGVSQMGTTFMNAAWFAGIDLVEFTPHSLYFTRYPEGREATISWGQIDVVVENDSPYGIMIVTDHDDTQVTVSFYSTSWAEVDSFTGERQDVVQGEVRDGFTIEFGRTIVEPDGTTRDETYTHTYEPEGAPEDDE